MGFYDTRILPYLLNVFMDTKGTRAERARTLEHVTGKVLEIGFGSGLNLPYYPPAVTQVVGVDPSETSAKLARKRIAASRFPVSLIGLSAERIPVEDASFDSIVTTFTLCSVADAPAALGEMRRALRPGGRLYFVEHGRAADPNVRKWQDRLNGVEQKVFGGCHLNRDIASLITSAGFRIEQLDHSYMEGAPKFVGYLYRGAATAS